MKTNLFRIVAAAALLAAFSCSKESEPEVIPVDTPEEATQAKGYTLIVQAEKGEPQTKALELSDDGKTLTPSWNKDEEVDVYKGDAKIGTLVAQSSGESTTLKGTIDEPLTLGDQLDLRFCSPNYDSQGGTLDYIATHCDYSTAKVLVSRIDEGAGTISITNATFVSQQAIVKFTLWQAAAPTSGIKPKTLSLTAGDATITVTPPDEGAADNEVFVAVPAVDGQPVSLRAVTLLGTSYGYSKPVASFEKGKFYAISVKMSNASLVHNDTELNQANNDVNCNYIIFANDITRASEALTIGSDRSVTIDLAGYSLSRNLGSAATKGCVIIVSNTANLKLTGGTITGGRNSEGGGGLINHGTAAISGCTFTGNVATTRGGAIWSSGDLTVENCSFTGNEALAEGGNNHNEGDGGAIHLEAGTATLTDVTITENTSKDAGGIYVKAGATLNLGGTSTINYNSSTEHGGGGIVNYGTVNLSGSVDITDNSCHTNGAGIWNNGTLSMVDHIRVKGNSGDDVYLKKDKVITTGTLTGGRESIGVNMEQLGVFTSGYETHNAGNTVHFFPSGTINGMGLTRQGEGKMLYVYYEASWNSTDKKVEYARRLVDVNASVPNLCSSTYAAGGNLTDSQWFVVEGTGSTTNGLTCGSGDRHIILCNGSQITINEGLFAPEGSTLYIHCQSYDSDMGKLTADNSNRGTGAGIGCKDGDGDANHPGTIIIHGGDIVAKGGKYAAGIGGGEDRPSGTITIWGGKVNATGGTDGAGIGGGEGGSGETITIYGGTVTAQGGGNGAGIGGGEYYHGGGKGGTITIWGGTITALGDGGSYCFGAGIGGGDFAEYSGEDVDSYQITIHGGNITARGGGWNSDREGGAAGIGGGRESRPGTIVINGGTIYAQGTYSLNHVEEGQYWTDYHYDGRGIGSGGLGKAGTVTINGGTITAVSYRGHHSNQGAFDPSGLTLADNLKVRGGDDESSATEATFEGRLDKCAYESWVRIEP